MKLEVKRNQEILIYNAPNGTVKVEILLQDETIWLTQQRIAELFGVDRTSISRHLKNIFESGELDPIVVCAEIAHTTQHGAMEDKTQTNNAKCYNLDAIISVGYRVNSKQATAFRMWATTTLSEYIIKGFTMDDERLKNPYNIFGKDYFDEQLARIRDIRSNERRFYQKITDIFAQCSSDYNVNAPETKMFFTTIQNKLHWAISEHTAAEIVVERADATKDNMGLTNWKNAPDGAIRKPDVSVAKNYLNEKELTGLNRIVTMYLDYAEMQAENGVVMTMNDWVGRLNVFLQFNQKTLLTHVGTVSHSVAKALAEEQFEIYREKQLSLYSSDFDELIEQSK